MADSASLTAGLTKASGEMAAFGQKMSAVGSGMTKYLTVPLVAVGAVATKMAVDYQSSLTKISALTGASTSQITKWSSEMENWAGVVGQTPKQLSEGLYFIASSGLAGAKAMDALKQSSRAAALGMGDTQTIADYATSAIGAYGQSAMTSAKALDILTAAVRYGKGEPEDFAHSLGMVTGTAAALKIPLDDVVGSITAMTMKGLGVPEATTALNNLMMTTMKGAKEGSDALDKYGLTYEKVADSFANKGVLETLKMLETKFHGSNTEMAKVFGNIRSIRAVMQLLKGDYAKTAEVIDKVRDSQGALNDAWAKGKDDPALQFKQTLADLSVAGIKIGNELLPNVLEAAEWVRSLAESFSSLSEGTRSFIVKAGMLTAVVGPMLFGLSKVVSLVSMVRASYLAAAAARAVLTAAESTGSASTLGTLGKAVGSGTGTAVSASAVAGIATPIAIAAVALAVPMVLMKTQKYVEGLEGAAATSAQNKGAGGAAFGSSKGYGQGGAAIRASALEMEKLRRAALLTGTAMDKVVASMASGNTTMLSGQGKLRDYVSRLKEMRTAAKESGNKELAQHITAVIRKFKDLVPAFKSKGLDKVFDGAGKSAQDFAKEIDAAKHKASNLRNEIKVKQKMGIDTKSAQKELDQTEAKLKRLQKQKTKLKVTVDASALKSAKALGLGGSAGIGASFAKAGKDASAKLAAGIQSGAGQVKSAAQAATQNAVTAAQTTASTESPAVGASLSSGIAAGINTSAAVGNAVATVRNAIAAARAEAQAKSPSRKMAALGSDMTAGLALGLAAGAKGVATAATGVAREAAAAISKGLGGLKGKKAKGVVTASEMSGAISTLVDFVSSIGESLAALETATVTKLSAGWKAKVKAIVKTADKLAAFIAQVVNKAFPWTKGKPKTKKRDAVDPKIGKAGLKVQHASEMTGPVGELVSFIVDVSEALNTVAKSTIPKLTDDMKSKVRQIAQAATSLATIVATELAKAFPKATYKKRKKKVVKTGGEALADLLAASEVSGPLGEVMGVVGETLSILQTMTEVDPRLFEVPADAFSRIGSIIANMATTLAASLSSITVPDAVLTAASRLQTLADSLLSVLEVMRGVSDVDAGNFGTAGWSNLVAAANGMVYASNSLPGLRGTTVAAGTVGGDTYIVQMENVNATSPAQATKAATATVVAMAQAKRRTSRGRH